MYMRLIHVTPVIECMARADQMDTAASVHIWGNKCLVGEMCYIMVIQER